MPENSAWKTCRRRKSWCARRQPGTKNRDRGAAGSSLAVHAFRRRERPFDAAVPSPGGILAVLAVVYGFDEVPVSLRFADTVGQRHAFTVVASRNHASLDLDPPGGCAFRAYRRASGYPCSN